jgi:hypothetical protein
VSIPDNHHFARYAGGSRLIDGETVDGSAFRVRPDLDADGLSGNWPEYFKEKSLEEALVEIRNAYNAKGRAIGARSKFAILSVGGTKDSVWEKEKRRIDFVHTPDCPLDLSHASVTGYNPGDEIIADIIAQTVIRLFPGWA